MLGFGTLDVPFCLAMFGLGMQEMLIFMVIVLVIFGSARLPSLMRNLGRSANEFKAGMKDPVGDGDEEKEDDPST